MNSTTRLITLAVDTTSSALQAMTDNKAPIYKGASSFAATLTGGFGKAVEKAGYRALVENTSKYKENYEPQYRNESFYNFENEGYKYYPVKIGNISNSLMSEYLSQLFEKNEDSVKNRVKEIVKLTN